MNREAQDSLLLLVGAMVLQVGLTDLHLRYVKPQMQPLLIVTGAGLVLLGLLGVLRQVRGARAAHGDRHDGDHHDDEHQHGPTRTSWLLVLPLLVLASVTPPTLGAYAASRGTTTVEAPDFALAPLGADRAGAVDLSLTDYYTRVLYDADSLQGRRIRLSGFVTPVGKDWYVSRIRLSCCAADGRPVNVLTDGAASRPAPASDTWVEVVGTATTSRAPDGQDKPVATLLVESVVEATRPQNSYEQ